MIRAENFKDVLTLLGFEKEGNRYSKRYGNNYEIAADFDKKILIYPKDIKGRDRNTAFSQPENFVVFECVCRLLDKGYRAEDIELEKEWHLGHDAKSGRADICVNDSNGSMLMIIECKTWGKEFDNALNETKNDGAQLFSYWQQEQSCKWLVLYSANYNEGKLEYKSPAINCSDDANILLLSEKDQTIHLYRDAHTNKEKVEAWKETYAGQIHDDLIISEESVAYQIGVKPLRKKDLRDFTPDDKIINKFEEILRHNNVSDKENAFNRLVALFICKLVDEIKKSDDVEVDFQYKQGTDTYETLQDRLQRLHSDGMKDFMREKIYYVPADYPELLFSNYTGSKRKQAIEDLQKTIRILKFYSNNDFAFKDVHNEELFYQNGKIIVEMVQLFEKYRIVYPSKHQFLGDLFEQLLNQGFKQNEGQFFTPMPITRFIWDCLPVDRIVKSEKGTVYPKIIDYACGAGHFLTEAIEAINAFADNGGNNDWVQDHIYGIEKDYRLARVAKISLFMNGAGEGNIIFGDGLENVPDKGIENGSFDILVANPPYSVKGFKQHLQLKNNDFSLLDSITLSGSEIETLFVERIGQLLKPCGIAAVILPSSILSNDSLSYTKAREQILQNFFIRAIVALGSKTFGETGTNTVILFLEKFNEPPKQLDLLSDSVEAIFNNSDISDWKDKEILEAYIAHIGVDKELYNAFLGRRCCLSDLELCEHFRTYVEVFTDSKDTKTLLNSKKFMKESAENQKEIYLEKFYNYAHPIEREKILYFSLIYQQNTVIITSPSDNKSQKAFLGYSWSKRKGDEGIKISSPGGKLYNPNNRIAEGTLADAVRKSFNGILPSFSEEQDKYGSIIVTKDLIDFSREVFNKTLRLSISTPVAFETEYALKPISQIFPIIESGSRPEGGVDQYSEGILSLGGEHIDNTSGYLNLKSPKYVPGNFYEEADKGKVKKGDILICKDGARTGKIALVRNELDGKEALINEHIFLLRSNNAEIQYYVYQLLYSNKGQELLKSYISGSAQGGLNKTNLEQIKLPMPPKTIISTIVTECTKIDEEYNTTRMSLETYKQKIEDLFAKLGVSTIENDES